MYRFEGEKIAKRGQGIKAFIPEDHLQLIVEYSKKYKSTQKAVIELKKSFKIDPEIAHTTYVRRLYKFEPYKEMVRAKEQLIKDKHDEVIRLRKQNVSYRNISKTTGVPYDTVYKIVYNNSDIPRAEKKKPIEPLTAKEKVKLWNDNYFPGRVPTTATIKAFKLLGLEPPKNDLK